MSVVEETSGKTMVGTDESFTEARALQVKYELKTMKKCRCPSFVFQICITCNTYSDKRDLTFEVEGRKGEGQDD